MENNSNTKYDLTEEEYNRCLSMAEISIFLNCQSEERPTSIFVVAQPGAGKTGLKSYVIRENNSNTNMENYIEFNPDEIAVFHSNYREILKEFPAESYSILQRFVKPALDGYLRKRAVELRTNIVQEGTFGAADAYLKILDFQKNGGIAKIGDFTEDKKRNDKIVKGGYNIDINILAVDRYESLLSSYEREQYFRENELPPRVVAPKNHDYSYEKMLETIEKIEERNVFDRMRVFKRGYLIDRPELVYVNGDNRYHNTVEAVKVERMKNRQELLKNPKAYLDRIEQLRQKAKEEEQIIRINQLQQEFTNELENYIGK